MKKLISVLVLSIVFGLGFSCVLTRSIAIAQVDSLSKSEQANYILARYVIGSGGVFGARSQNYFQHGTAGQTIIGGAQSPNNFLISGFWIRSSIPIGVSPSEQLNLPTAFILHQNYPNPFNPETIIRYDLPNACLVSVEIYNTVGQRIRLVSSQLQGPGQANVVWDGRDEQGQVMGSGVYFCRITASAPNKNYEMKFQQTKKMLLVK